jgi:formylmethanofuran dehydrogenase subunit E
MFFTGKFAQLAKSKKQKIDATNMIECETCGSYVAEKDAVHAHGNDYCSIQCRDA